MKSIIRFIIYILVCMLLAACSNEPTVLGHQPTNTRRLTLTHIPTDTTTPTATTIPTIIPMVTSSPGPAPDLELYNATIRGAFYPYLRAEIKNNTDQAMVFPAHEPIMKFSLENWFDAGQRKLLYIHPSATIEGDSYDDRISTCVLFPGESGVISSDLRPNISTEKEVDSFPYGIGYRITSYQGLYKSWKEFQNAWDEYKNIKSPDPKLHPLVKNVTYQIKGSYLEVNFDTETFLPPYLYGFGTHSWIILYRSDGSIVDILYSTHHLLDKKGPYNIFAVGIMTGSDIPPAQYASSDPSTFFFYNNLPGLSPEEISSIDHIQILIEEVDANMCNEKVFL